MNKADLIDAMAEGSSLSKTDAERALNAFLQTVKDALGKGDNVVLTGFGTFEVADRAARKGRNPRTGEEIDIPASKLPKFKPGKGLKDAVS